jgi:hypothetical protein
MFRPQRIVTLFVGESPPHGGTFFYKADSILYRAMKEAFAGSDNFLAEFKARGFFLEDLVHEPVNRIKDTGLRNEMRLKAVTGLAVRMADYRPAAVVAVMCAIEPMVADAIREVGLGVPLYTTPFPGRYHRRQFMDEMTEIIPKLPTL